MTLRAGDVSGPKVPQASTCERSSLDGLTAPVRNDGAFTLPGVGGIMGSDVQGP